MCYPTEKNRINKIRSLLSDMKIASRLLEVGCEDDFIPLLDTPMDYTETRNYIAQKIQEADDFLVLICQIIQDQEDVYLCVKTIVDAKNDKC